MECSICGISGEMRPVFEVISPKGVIFACDKCASEEGFPILKKPKRAFFEEPEKRGTVSEVMARLSGVKPRERELYNPELKKQETSLRKIIDKNYEEKIKKQDLILKLRPDLTDNFHWIIMRVRRIKGLTQKQLADMIGESEAAIKMAEQGVVPESYSLIDKLERFLKVKLIKERIFPMHIQNKEKNKRTVSFDKQSLDSLTIYDLQRIKKEREEMLAEKKTEELYETTEEEKIDDWNEDDR